MWSLWDFIKRLLDDPGTAEFWEWGTQVGGRGADNYPNLWQHVSRGTQALRKPGGGAPQRECRSVLP